jgi:basic membrane lipoprotein Med (substrate-binding protein (PBP1-ABC) superfamily)
MRFFLIICITLAAIAVQGAPLKVAFVYVSPVGDVGWTYSHDLGRQYAEEHLGDTVRTQFFESVPEGRKAREILRKLAQKNDVIFATSWGYMVSMEQVAKQYPDVKFEHATGIRHGNNLSTYATRIYEARYLSGIVAASMSKTNRIGYVAAFPVPEVIRGLNAFTLGAQSINPDIEVAVQWTKAWYAPKRATQLSHALIDGGADVLAQHTDSPAPVEVAETRGVYAIGYHSNMSPYGPNAHLVSVTHDWGLFYHKRIKSFMDNSAKTEDSWTGLKEGSVKLSAISSAVPNHVMEKVEQAKQKISSGELNIFAGPIKNHKGRVRVKVAKTLTDDALKRMSWYVAGINGDLKIY